MRGCGFRVGSEERKNLAKKCAADWNQLCGEVKGMFEHRAAVQQFAAEGLAQQPLCNAVGRRGHESAELTLTLNQLLFDAVLSLES